MKSKLAILNLFAIALLAFVPESVYAHHPNGYKLPESFGEGLLSGFGHPVIGIDHLVFIISMGLLSYSLRQRAMLPLAFVASTSLGTALHLNGVNIIGSEMLVATSVLLLGVAMISRIKLPSKALWLAAFSVSGVLHGYAYGESIVGAEATVISAYLIGFMTIQLVICYSAYLLCHSLSQIKSHAATSKFVKISGIGALLTGLFFLVA